MKSLLFKKLLSKKLCATAVLTTMLSPVSPFLLQSANAQTTNIQALPPLPIEFNPDNLINPGRPGGRRRGGGSRGGCQSELPLSAIAYADSQVVEELGVTRTDETVGGLTAQPRPILWCYLPAPVHETAAELVVQDSQEQVVFQGQLAGETERPGVVGLELEDDLRVGEPYQWFLTIDCDETERVTVNGWVERRAVGPDATRTLAQAMNLNRVALSADYGLGQDVVSELAQLRYFKPEDELIEQAWTQLLVSLELSDLIDEPVLPCCAFAGDVPDAVLEEGERVEPEGEPAARGTGRIAS